MNKGHLLLKLFTIVLVLTLGVSMNACASGGASWKEEVLLHDGSKVIVKRSQSYGGRHEIGQTPPIKEQDITFTLPGTNKTVTWKDEYSDDVGHANFNLLALHVLNGTPYIVAYPYGSLAYNKWGSPNPPYVFFAYDDNKWQRIYLSEFPAECKEINLVISPVVHEAEIKKQSLVRAEVVKKFNSSARQPEFQIIVREPLDVWKPRPEYKGPKAPHPITPPTKRDSNK